MSARHSNWDSLFENIDIEVEDRTHEVSGKFALSRETLIIEPQTSSMPRQRIVMAGLAIAGGLGTFLPWVSLPLFGSISGTAPVVGTWGWLLVSLFALTVREAWFRGNRAQTLDVGDAVAAAAPALTASMLGLFGIVRSYLWMADVGMTSKSVAGDIAAAFGGTASIGVGLFLIAAAGPAILTVALTEHREREGGQTVLGHNAALAGLVLVFLVGGAAAGTLTERIERVHASAPSGPETLPAAGQGHRSSQR